MTKFKLLFVVVLMLVYTSHSVGQQTNGDPIMRVFEVDLKKTSYLMLEPIYATFKASPEPHNRILDPKRSSIRISFGGKIKVYRGLTMWEITDTPVRIPNVNGLLSVLTPTVPWANTVSPPPSAPPVSKLFDEQEIVIDRVAEFFPMPGRYQLQFEYNGALSNTIDITINEATALDLEAFDILRKYEDAYTFDWARKGENGRLKLEEFVEKYRQTVYGEYAAVHLARTYFLNGDRTIKTRSLLEELVNSPHKSVATDAQSMLNEIVSRQSEAQHPQK